MHRDQKEEVKMGVKKPGRGDKQRRRQVQKEKQKQKEKEKGDATVCSL